MKKRNSAGEINFFILLIAIFCNIYEGELRILRLAYKYSNY